MAYRRSSHRRARRRSSSQRWTYIAGAAVALSLVVAVILLSAVSRGGSDTVSAEIIVPTPRPSGAPTDGTIYGDPNAPVTVTEYLDFQCPICLRAGLNVISEIDRRYVDTGQVKLEVKPIAILGDESVAAAAAAQCATDQGRFWAYHDILFANQGAENDGGYSNDRLKTMAERIGLDTAAFNSCLDSGKYDSQVRSNTDAAKAMDVKGTPTIFVNGVKVETSVEAISAAVDSALSAGQ